MDEKIRKHIIDCVLHTRVYYGSDSIEFCPFRYDCDICYELFETCSKSNEFPACPCDIIGESKVLEIMKREFQELY